MFVATPEMCENAFIFHLARCTENIMVARSFILGEKCTCKSWKKIYGTVANSQL